MTQSSVPEKGVRSLLSSCGCTGGFDIRQIPAGGNNKVYKVSCESGQTFLVKRYFSDRADPRNRLKTEYSFVSFLSRHSITAIPRPYAAIPEENLGMYQYVPGRQMRTDEVSEDRIQELVCFFLSINQLRSLPDAADLPDASEACFSLQEHLDTVRRRVERLESIPVTAPVDERAFGFIRDRLQPAWNRVSEEIAGKTARDARLSYVLPRECRVLSPSDFGFHNVIVTPENRLVFIDFEYAGWDDPVKTICDLFCQPKIPLDIKQFETVASAILTLTGADRGIWMSRVRLLYPAYLIKWCCILLNEFLPVDGRRRDFAASDSTTDTKKAEQLDKAERYLSDRRV
jgi:thiamine kinase-like enzyme